MNRFDTTSLIEKSAQEQAEILWLAFEDLVQENLFESFEQPTAEEGYNLTIVLAIFCSHIFEAVLTSTSGHTREKIAGSWAINIQAILNRQRVLEAGPSNGTGEKEKENGEAGEAVQA